MKLLLAILLVLSAVAAQAQTPRHGLPYTNSQEMNKALDKIDARMTYGATTSEVRLCGQNVNTTTVYGGPAVSAFWGRSAQPVQGDAVCDALESGTEATADNPLGGGLNQYRIVGMRCSVSSDPASDVVFTARSAAADLSPSLTCTVAGTGTAQDCSVSAGGVAPTIVSNNPIAVKVVTLEDLSAQDFSCQYVIQY